MRKLRLIFLVALTAFFMTNEACFAQAKRGGDNVFQGKEKGLKKPDGRSSTNGKKNNGPQSVVMPPLKALDLKTETEKLQKQGWKTEQYSIAAQLSSCCRVMTEIDSITFKPVFVWAQCESKEGNMKKAQIANFEKCTQKIENQLMGPVLLECSKSMMTQKIAPEKIAYYLDVIEKSAFSILKRSCQKSMEFYKIEDKSKSVSVRTMLVTSKIGFYKMLQKEVSMQTKEQADSKLCIEILRDAYKRMGIAMK